MPAREFAVVIRADGEKVIPRYPIELRAGDSFIVVREMRGSEVPKGKSWTVLGYSSSGPIINDSD